LTTNKSSIVGALLGAAAIRSGNRGCDYVEPFGGSCAVLFGRPDWRTAQVEIVNDAELLRTLPKLSPNSPFKQSMTA
jgi:hypothetical protein